MKKIIHILSTLVMFGAATAGEQLSGDGLKAFFTDKTIVGVHFKSGLQKTFYGSDGRVQSQSDSGKTHSGKWWIEEGSNKRCVRWDNKPKDLCHFLERNNDGSYTLIHGKKGNKLVEISTTMDGNQL